MLKVNWCYVTRIIMSFTENFFLLKLLLDLPNKTRYFFVFFPKKYLDIYKSSLGHLYTRHYITSLSLYLVTILFHHYHSHMKRKDSLEGSMDRVLFVAEFEFPKILVPRLPQNLSNENSECTKKSQQLYSLCDKLLEPQI